MAEGQYVAYTFYRVDPAWRRVPVEERAAGKDAFAEVVESWAVPTVTSSSGRSRSATPTSASSAPS